MTDIMTTSSLPRDSFNFSIKIEKLFWSWRDDVDDDDDDVDYNNDACDKDVQVERIPKAVMI